MEDMFNNLNEKMNRTILKDIEFGEKNKEAVRKSVRASKRKKSNLQFRLKYILSVSISCVLLLGLGLFSFNKLGGFSDDQSIPENTIQSPTNSNKNLDTKEGSMYTPPNKEEYFDDMNKREVLSKMLNTPMHFKTVAGKFEEQNIYNDGTGSTVNVKYKLSMENKVGGYVSFKNHSLDGELVQNEKAVHNDNQVWNIDLMRKSYRESEYDPKELQKKVSVEEALSIDSSKVYDKLLSLYDWEAPPTGTAGISLFPFHKAVQYLGDYEQWDIEKQNAEILGHNTIVLSGEVKDKVARMKNVETFRFWVDKDTGILVKYEEYDSNGNITSYLHPKKLEINVSVDSKEFIPSLTGLTKKEIPAPHYEDSREKEIEVIEHADYYKEDVDQVLQTLREDISFLYEFTGSEYELYAASYERYKSFNQAYLTYSYKKGENVEGSGTRLLYVRTYHKDSVTRSSGAFDTNKGKRIEKFTTNDIDWTVYELDRPQSAHFVGTSNEYIYEVVTQEITAKEAMSLVKFFKPSKEE
ncbi:hypothetical protein [Virgibacillus sp. JSM 102003]|uniref:hypothetical protein n=1 Tax=Virgibacillus sp. JSM 102003 TaxID=1562108 RepID=UPI0035C098D3